MHLTLEQLLAEEKLNATIKTMIGETGR